MRRQGVKGEKKREFPKVEKMEIFVTFEGLLLSVII